MKRFVQILCLLLITTVCGLSRSQSLSPLSQANSFDPFFNRYGQRFLAHIPQSQYWLSAQAKQESAYNPLAVSHAGAKGLMQTMDRTHAEISHKLGIKCSQFNAQCSILFGAYYDSVMYRTWDRRERTVNEILPLMFGSYNIGTGGMLKAQKRCFDARLWSGISPCLPEETRNYVPRIRNHFCKIRN